MIRILFTLRATLAVGVAGLLAQAALAPVQGAEAKDLPNAFSFRLETPSIQVEELDRGFARIDLDGFERGGGQLGAPDIPLRTVLVAIPSGAVPRLEVSPASSSKLLPQRPVPRAAEYAGPPTLLTAQPEPKREFESRPTPVYSAEPSFYEIEGTYPPARVWLGKTGVLRDQRYVEVHLAPLRYDGPSGGLVVDADIAFTVHFDGSGTKTSPPREGSRFESVYRSAFVNYAQGRRFRLSAPEAAVALRSAAATVEASVNGVGTGPRRRIRVRETGFLRLDYAYLQTHAPEFLAEPVANWRLTSQGVQVPLRIEQISGSGFDDALIDRPGEFVQFYGQALDMEPISEFISDDQGTGDLLYAARDFTDENVYFLTTAVTEQPPIEERDAAPDVQSLAGPFFYDTLHEEVDDFFWPYAEQDLFYWEPFLGEDDLIRNFSVVLPDLYSTTLPVTFRVHVRGGSECRPVSPDKQSGVSIINDSAQQLQLPASDTDNVNNQNIGIFDGLNGFTHEFGWAHAGGEPELTSPLQVRLELFDNTNPCGSGGPEIRDSLLPDWIEIDYPRSFVADGDTLVFEWNDGPATRFEIPGFGGPVEVYEISRLLPSSEVYDAVRLINTESEPNGADFTARFRMDNDPALTDGTPRRFVVTTADAITTPDPLDFEGDRVSELLSDTTQADLVVIVHPDLVYSVCSESMGSCDSDNDCSGGAADRCEIDPASELAQLLALRAGQGISSRVVRMPDIEDELNQGLPGPLAIRNFIAWLVTGGWQGEPPSFVMLVGDSSYDYKAGTANGTYVPTQLVLKTDDVLAFYSSDNLLAAVLGEDFLPELLVGRIAARTKDEAAAVFQKIREYDEFPTAGSWRSNALVISDKGHQNDPDEAGQFEAMNAQALSWLDSVYTSQNVRFWTDYCNSGNTACDVDGMHDAIIDGVNGELDSGIDGAAIVQFVGHGHFDFWSDAVILCAREGNPHPRCSQDDTLSMFNDDLPGRGGQLPWLIVHNCLTGGFHGDKLKSMGEQWLKRDGGGSIAVFAPSGLGFRFIGVQVIDEVWRAIYDKAKERDLAVPVMNSLVRLCTGLTASPEVCQYHVLLGDPSMRLNLPHVDPPKSLQAIAGNGEVSLSWDPSTTPGIEYYVYRARFYDGPGTFEDYELVGGEPTGQTTLVDGDVTNSFYYAYYVVARDAEGFDSAWSNFNDDCNDEPVGDGCVLARPLNDIPPIPPEGGETEDPATGGTLNVWWDPNPEGDIDFYMLHYGSTVDLGQTVFVEYGTSSAVHGLENGTEYYFAITATNRSGTTSDLSEIFTGVPTLVLGVRAPDFVDDLTLDREGANALLSWSPVTLDIYGAVVSVGEYEIYRGEFADFLPGVENRIGTTATAAFTDSGAASTAEPDYCYLVRALDVAGNPGGLGRQLPRGIEDLVAAASDTSGQLILSWSAVTKDFDQQPTQISHYELYASDQPFGRAEIEQDEIELLDGAIPGNSVEFLPASQSRYYSVLAVDTRGNRSPF